MKALFALLISLQAFAGEVDDAALFRHRFQSEINLAPQIEAHWLESVMYVPDDNLIRALHAGSASEMLNAAKGGHLATLAAATAAAPAQSATAEPSYTGRNLTIVVVPGVLAEFVQTRAFEEIFERPSTFRDELAAKVAAAKAAGNPAATDPSGSIKAFGRDADNLPLDQLLSAGELDVHGAHVRVVLLNTPFASLESLGATAESAAIFKRRLEKYFSLMGTGPLAIIGYSRGTPIALEMLASGKRDGSAWVSDVKGMIALSGVVLGSSLADQAFEDPTSATHKLLENIKGLASSLEEYPEGQNPGWVKNRNEINANDKRWLHFLKSVIPSGGGGASLASLERLAAVDPRAPISIVARMWSQFDLSHPHHDYNRKIERFRYFVKQLESAFYDLSSKARADWFQQHALPLEPIYYAVPSAMADPSSGSPEDKLFLSPLGYAPGSFDDSFLAGNRHDYEAISGLALNDSQVGSIQATFPAGVLEGLNPANHGMKTKLLGVAGTHHWGIALREVNHMIRGGQNGFPREALLRALAVQVLEDSR